MTTKLMLTRRHCLGLIGLHAFLALLCAIIALAMLHQNNHFLGIFAAAFAFGQFINMGVRLRQYRSLQKGAEIDFGKHSRLWDVTFRFVQGVSRGRPPQSLIPPSLDTDDSVWPPPPMVNKESGE